MLTSTTLSLASVLVALAGHVINVDAGGFLAARQMSAADLQTTMLEGIAQGFRHSGRGTWDRVDELEDLLRPMYTALPKDSSGGLSHTVVRYALHRLFMQTHSWFVRGLNPGSEARNASANMTATFALDSVPVLPALLQNSMERAHGTGLGGLSLRETAILAAAIEDVIHRENREKLSMAYEVLSVSTDEQLPSRQANLAIATFMTMYLLGSNFTNWTVEEVRTNELRLLQTARWAQIQEWIDEEWRNVSASAGVSMDADMAFNSSLRVVQALTEDYGRFNEDECHQLKHTLLGMEGRKPGRVRLSDFYNGTRHSVWLFKEKIEYLRVLGALDESNASNPQVIVPNYITSMPQCLRGSSIYSTCCTDECEELVAVIEAELAAPEAEVSKLLAIVSGLSSDTVVAPRQLPDPLVQRLTEVAAHHGGRVPIHGRLFAQWMHHAFPRECNYPHPFGSVSPLTPDEWMRETGHSSVGASEEEMLEHIRPDDTCSLGNSGAAGADPLQELPWNHAEEVFNSAPFVNNSATNLVGEASAEADRASGSGFLFEGIFLVGVLIAVVASPKTLQKEALVTEKEVGLI